MEENNTIEEKTVEIKTEKACECKMHPLLKGLLCGLLLFLGAFCAAYTIIDWHVKSFFRPMFPPNSEMFEKTISRDMQLMDKMMKDEGMIHKKGGNIIHLEHGKNAYKIMVDLKAFDNNENNLNVSTESNVLTVSGRTVNKTSKKEQIMRFQQSYMFGDDVKLDGLQKNTDGRYMIITIPIVRNTNDED